MKIEVSAELATIQLTQRELSLLMLYWPGDVENMGDADANNPSDPIQPIGQSVLDKLCKATALLQAGPPARSPARRIAVTPHHKRVTQARKKT